MKKVVVYCASSNNIDDVYLDSAYQLGVKLANSGIDVIYGGGRVGLMGNLAEGVLEAQGKIYGIIPEFMIPLELGHNGVSELIITKDMHERQAKMMQMSDAAIVLPGGSGTMLEFMEIISWKRLGLLISPVIVCNLNNYWDELLEMLNKSIKLGFMDKDYDKLWRVSNSIDETIDLLMNCFDISRSNSLG